METGWRQSWLPTCSLSTYVSFDVIASRNLLLTTIVLLAQFYR
jgi:hypothetical protein